jgi:hypothetical protein
VEQEASQVSAKLDQNRMLVTEKTGHRRASEDGMTLVSRIRPVPHGSV